MQSPMEELALMSMRLLMRERSPKLELHRELIRNCSVFTHLPSKVVLLVIGAVYEAFSLRYLVHPLAQWLL